MQKSLESLSLELSRALSPLRGKISSFDQYLNFMLTELGWNVDSLPPPVQNLSSDIDNLVNQINTIGEADVSPNRLIDIISALVKLFRDIDAVRNLPPGSFSPALEQEGFLSTFPKELVDFLLIDFLRQYYPLEYTLSLQPFNSSALQQRH